MRFHLLYTIQGGQLRLSSVDLPDEPAPAWVSSAGHASGLLLRVATAVTDSLKVAKVRSSLGNRPLHVKDLECKGLFVDGRPEAIWVR